MSKIFLWGTGQVAETLWRNCQTLTQYELLGFIDNNPEKQGTLFMGLHIYPPTVLNDCRPDHIVILTDAYDEVYQQIMDIHPEMKNIIENKNFFYKESILKRYKGTTVPEEIEVLNYIKRNGLDIFNYEFSQKYKKIDAEVYLDAANGMYYVMHFGKRLYFSRDFNCEKKVVDYYRSILLEQDICSPHRYLTKDFDIEDGDIIVDAGVAEGNFSLEVVDRVSKLYLIEADTNWIEALKETFKSYQDKVVIIQKYVSSYNDGNFATLDSLIQEPVNFIKMDIEGNEWDALQGAEELISKSPNLKCAVCSYHSDFDQILIEDFMDKHGLIHTTTPGYMWFPFTVRQNYVSTRLNRAVIRAEKQCI